jgi:hypothetical protein
MSQVTSPTAALRSQVAEHRIVALSALLALLATAAVVLVLAIDGGTSDTSSVAQKAQPALRSDGGPEESHVAAAASAPASPGPVESHTAAAIGAGTQAQSEPSRAYVSESRIAAAIAGH